MAGRQPVLGYCAKVPVHSSVQDFMSRHIYVVQQAGGYVCSGDVTQKHVALVCEQYWFNRPFTTFHVLSCA